MGTIEIGKLPFLSSTGFATLGENCISFLSAPGSATQDQTAQAFSKKWGQMTHGDADFEKMVANQKEWYLDLYGFSSEDELRSYLRNCGHVLDAGTGMGHKAAWFAELSPETFVVAADISDSIIEASAYYRHLPNLLFVQCDIADLGFVRDNSFDYVSCDQVIHHTEAPRRTFRELARVAATGGDVSVYVYRKKALPRELLDDYFREACADYSHEQLMELSEQLTELGRVLSSLDQPLAIPDVPLLGIEGGEMTVQRFIYWNLLKCYWNEELGEFVSVMTNYDWYSPSQAFRYTEEEFRSWVEEAAMETVHFHKEKACYSGRFRKTA
ncbi:class I SAM-dependent methyltransferase [Desulfohalovibrio reitneri]|uniref:class I SAM-dependent methyltransferase n=1 Tax=Desulfohalovibrio reitneri TaxID=1307759 RepID=UPI00069074BC|nr:class I SAM-dependent methyltransferase [Desulfohalovibrio reitneri]